MTYIKYKEIRDAIEDIKEHEGDPEAQHSLKDDLYRNALRTIRKGSLPDPVRVARMALEVEKLDFPEWCG